MPPETPIIMTDVLKQATSERSLSNLEVEDKTDQYVVVIQNPPTKQPNAKEQLVEAGAKVDEPNVPNRFKVIADLLQKALIGILMGIQFGVAMERGKVTSPITIRKQFLFQRFIMIKMFLSAAMTGAFCFTIMSLLIPKTFDTVRSKFMSSRSAKGLIPVVLGTAMLGCGMAVCGACPGMVYIQLGAGVPNAIITLVGGLAGALVYGLMQPFITKFLAVGLSKQQKLDDFEVIKDTPYWKMGLALIACLAIPIALFEYFFPWTSSSELSVTSSTVYEQWKHAWLPELSGILVGSLQIPAVLLTSGTVGSSSTYMTMVSQVLVTPGLQEKFKHMDNFRSSASMWQSVIYIWSAALGAYIASGPGGTFGSAKGVDAGAAFVGGFLMLFGSRMAGGCTSGHGLSGFPLCSLQSWLGTPAMFAGGIVTAFIYQAADRHAFIDSLE